MAQLGPQPMSLFGLATGRFAPYTTSHEHQQGRNHEPDGLHAHGRLTATSGPEVQEVIGQDHQVPHQFAGGLVQVFPKARGEEGVQDVNRHPRLAHIDPA